VQTREHILPRELMLHVRVLGAALLLSRRADDAPLGRRTAAGEAALRESEERLRLVGNNVRAHLYVDREQRYRFFQPHYDDCSASRTRHGGRTVARCSARRPMAACARTSSVPRRERSIEFTTAEVRPAPHAPGACVPHRDPQAQGAPLVRVTTCWRTTSRS